MFRRVLTSDLAVHGSPTDYRKTHFFTFSHQNLIIVSSVSYISNNMRTTSTIYPSSAAPGSSVGVVPRSQLKNTVLKSRASWVSLLANFLVSEDLREGN